MNLPPLPTFPPDAGHLAEAVARLRAGRLVAFPTETVYGLGADARSPAALAGIFKAKGRPADHPLIVHVPAGADPAYWTTDLPPLAVRLIERFWPGPLTLILKRAPGVPSEVAGGQDTVGLRCPDHPLAQALLAGFCASAPADPGRGVAAPSANRFGQVSPTQAGHVASEFPGADVFILDGGPCPLGIESTILDVSRLDGPGAAPVLLRPGSIAAEQLAEAIGALPARPDAAAPRVSGALAAHYAPRTPLLLVDGAVLDHYAAAGAQAAVVWSWSRAPQGPAWQRAPAKPADYARELYARLREFDTLGVARIVVERPPADPAWAALHDRLGRAATGSGRGHA